MPPPQRLEPARFVDFEGQAAHVPGIRTKTWARLRGGIAFPCFIVVVLLSLAHVVLAVFWTNHDIYDDSGYNLSIFRGMAGGGRLYETVLSNYGPFHYQAWLLWFRALHFPVDHDHVALGVALIWAFAVGVAGWLAWRFCRKNGWVAAGVIFWSALSLGALSRELGHPKSLAVLLCALMLGGLAVAVGRKSRVAWAVVGMAAGCLLLTKVNHGVFALAALTLGFWIHLAPRRWMVPVAGLLGAALPFALVFRGWSLECRVLFATSLGLSIAMTVQIGGRLIRAGGDKRIRWSDAGVCFGSCALTVLAVLLVAKTTGTTWHSLFDGIFLRPLEFSRFFQVTPEPVMEDWAVLAVALLLAAGWQIPALRRRSIFWQSALAGLVFFRLCLDHPERQTYLFTGSSLLWLAMAAQQTAQADDPESSGWHGWLAFAALMMPWQMLCLFPVFGAQVCLPMYLDVCVLALALGRVLVVGLKTGAQPKSTLWAQRSFAGLWAFGLLTLALTAGAAHLKRVQNSIASGCKGAAWLSWSREQTALLRCVTENLKNCEGPVFTLHSQPSFTLWSGKEFASGMNPSHVSGMLRPAEEEAMFRAYENRAHWSAVVLGDGSMFLPLYRNAATAQKALKTEAFDVSPIFRDVDKIGQWLAVKTDPWMRVNGYQLRLSKGTLPKAPVYAIWQQQGAWMMSFPESILSQIRRAELRVIGLGPWNGLPAGSRPVAYFKWEPLPWQKVPGMDGMLQGPVPTLMAATLDQHPFVERGIWLLDDQSNVVATLPLVVMESQINHP